MKKRQYRKLLKKSVSVFEEADRLELSPTLMLNRPQRKARKIYLSRMV